MIESNGNQTEAGAAEPAPAEVSTSDHVAVVDAAQADVPDTVITDGGASPPDATAPTATSDEQVQSGAEDGAEAREAKPTEKVDLLVSLDPASLAEIAKGMQEILEHMRAIDARVQALEETAQANGGEGMAGLSKFLENLNTTVNDRLVRVEQKIKHF